MRRLKISILLRVVIAIILGIVFGNVLSETWVRLFLTFNAVFSQFLGFIIPLIILGLVCPTIAGLGHSAGKMLMFCVAIAYIDTVMCGILSYGTGSVLFPSMVERYADMSAIAQNEAIEPFFTISIPPMIDVMTALVFAFVVGLGIAYNGANMLKTIFDDFRIIITKVIEKVVIPLLPLYIFGIFLNMTHTGEVYSIISIFAKIICVIFVLHIVILLYQFIVAGVVAKRNPFRLLYTMLPAYLTALGTSSSAATIPVTLKQTIKNGVSNNVAGFSIPLCATIHMSGSVMKITACALTICLFHDMPHDIWLFLSFILMLSVMMVAAPGVPGGAVMASLAPLSSILGFDSEAQALMIALYIAMDSFGTACNVTGDGAIAIVTDKFFNRQNS